MKVFLSWSGPLSQALADALYRWLPKTLQAVRPYFTPNDIEKGLRWGQDLAGELQASQMGIFCYTRDNLNNPWLLFEAGAISKHLDKAHVCPILFGVENSDLPSPLKPFQTTIFRKDDMYKLFLTINSSLESSQLSETHAAEVFDLWWPKLEEEVLEILRRDKDLETLPKYKDDRQLLEEISDLVSYIAKQNAKNQVQRPLSEPQLKDLVDRFSAVHSAIFNRATYPEIMRRFKKLYLPMRAIVALHEVDAGDQVTELLLSRLADLSFAVMPPQNIEDDIPF